MTQFLFIILSVMSVTTYSTAELTCKYPETLVKCPTDCSDYCPKSENHPLFCLTPEKCPPPACKCRFNFRRAENGTCIPITSCSSFDCSARPNEEYNACPPYCPTDECSQATPDGRCPFLGSLFLVLECRPTCRCIKDYWRKNGVCVPFDQCPGKGHDRSS